jgi:hypothetical protein
MSNATPAITFPADLNACHALMEQLIGTIEEQANKIEALDREKQDLQLAYAALLQKMFARRSERYIEDPSQLALDFGDSDDAADAYLHWPNSSSFTISKIAPRACRPMNVWPCVSRKRGRSGRRSTSGSTLTRRQRSCPSVNELCLSFFFGAD